MSRKEANGDRSPGKSRDISTAWTGGPRTPAWDRLWRIILSDLDPEPVRPDTQQRGRGGDHG
jgi:hypothetical protein